MNKNIIIISLIVALVLFGLLNYILNRKLAEESKRRRAVEQANVRLMLDSIRRQKGFTEVVKHELDLLAKQFEAVEPDVTYKISKAIELLTIGQNENAIEDLAVVMENLLLQYYEHDTGFKGWLKKLNRKMDLHHLLIYSKEDKKITDVELQFFLGVKTIRNKEDHILKQQLDDSLCIVGLITGIRAIGKIASFWSEKRHGSFHGIQIT